jgi:hypothetical protein
VGSSQQKMDITTIAIDNDLLGIELKTPEITTIEIIVLC